MHLDTLITMVDHEAFVVHPDIDRLTRVHRLTPSGAEPVASLRAAVSRALDEPVRWITGGGDAIAAERELWNDANNVLALAPGSSPPTTATRARTARSPTRASRCCRFPVPPAAAGAAGRAA